MSNRCQTVHERLLAVADNELGLDEVWKKILNEVKKDFFKFRQAHVVRRAGFFARTFNNMGVAQARCSKGGRSPPFEQRTSICDVADFETVKPVTNAQ